MTGDIPRDGTVGPDRLKPSIVKKDLRHGWKPCLSKLKKQTVQTSSSSLDSNRLLGVVLHWNFRKPVMAVRPGAFYDSEELALQCERDRAADAVIDLDP